MIEKNSGTINRNNTNNHTNNNNNDTRKSTRKKISNNKSHPSKYHNKTGIAVDEDDLEIVNLPVGSNLNISNNSNNNSNSNNNNNNNHENSDINAENNNNSNHNNVIITPQMFAALANSVNQMTEAVQNKSVGTSFPIGICVSQSHAYKFKAKTLQFIKNNWSEVNSHLVSKGQVSKETKHTNKKYFEELGKRIYFSAYVEATANNGIHKNQEEIHELTLDIIVKVMKEIFRNYKKRNNNRNNS